jgi:ribonuclease HI
MMDVVCVQEPFTFPGSRTQNHPGYDCYAPVDSWDSEDPEEREAERPRVMTYVRKGAGLKTQQRRLIHSRDMLWIDVNGYAILNAYRQPLSLEVIDYVTHLAPPSNCLVGGDFNSWHDTFEPGVQSAHQGAELARWSSESGMDFIGTPGEPTQRAGHVLDLTFSNIPFAQSTIRPDMHSGSDHETQITIIPGRGRVPLEQFHHRVPDTELDKFAGLVEIGVARLADPWLLTDTEDIDSYVASLAEVLSSSIQAVGKPDRGGGSPAPWWTPECQEAYREHLATRSRNDDGPTMETREFHAIVRKAKKDYWKHIINGVSDDKSLYKVIGWHKLASNLKAPPLEVNGVMVEDTLEKAEALRSEVLDRFNAEDDLDHDPLQDWDGPGNLNWEQTVSLEEVERNTIGVSSTSPGTDRVTVRLLKACWDHVKHAIHGLYSRCLALNYFPQSWKLAEVAMLPKVGKKDKTSVRSWRPIALLSCISKGLERVIARRIAWTALTNGILSPQHGGALPKRSAMDLVACFTHDVESAMAAGLEVTMITMDVQGAFDALLVKRLLKRMTTQGWPLPLLQLVNSFLTDRKVRVRLEKSTTPYHDVACGTPQGSPLSPVLYMLYLAELLAQDTSLRFGYADDICLHRATKSLDDNVRLLASDVRGIMAWGADNKIAFAPEKLEMIHLTKKAGGYAPQCTVNDELTITPITTAPKDGDQPALRWLGVWFDRKLTFKRHVSERAAKARKVSQHIRSLARTVDGPPASALRKAVTTCVMPSMLYGTEAWYAGRTKPPRQQRQGRDDKVSARVGWHVDIVDKTLALAARGVLPVWRTTPTVTLFRDSGLPSAMAALEETKLRFAMRLQTVDKEHPLAKRIEPPMITRGRGAGSRQRPKTKVQRLGTVLPSIPRPTLRLPHFTTGCRVDPTGGIDKETASAAFKEWWAALPPEDVTIFSDGSEKHEHGERFVGYGYAIYQKGKQIASGHGAINSESHVFDAEAIGAWKGLQHTIGLPPDVSQRRLWLCIDSTSVIWCLRGDASNSSQWAFHECQDVMRTHNVNIRWAPGHTGIEGNEAADALADLGARQQWDAGLASEPTVSGIRSIFRRLRREAQCNWWAQCSTKLSKWYKKWGLEYRVRSLAELELTRPILHRLLALRTSHGDFAWYHTKFKHDDAKLTCSCGRVKAPEHIVHCRKTVQLFHSWPQKPRCGPPSSPLEGIKYLSSLMAKPTDFAKLLTVTEFYSKICTR